MKDCESCKAKMPTPESVPYIVHESAMARSERMVKRLWITILVLIALLVGTNVAWLIYESQFEVVESWEIIQENEDGYNNYIGNDGDIVYGETDDSENA